MKEIEDGDAEGGRRGGKGRGAQGRGRQGGKGGKGGRQRGRKQQGGGGRQQRPTTVWTDELTEGVSEPFVHVGGGVAMPEKGHGSRTGNPLYQPFFEIPRGGSPEWEAEWTQIFAERAASPIATGEFDDAPEWMVPVIHSIDRVDRWEWDISKTEFLHKYKLTVDKMERLAAEHDPVAIAAEVPDTLRKGGFSN